MYPAEVRGFGGVWALQLSAGQRMFLMQVSFGVLVLHVKTVGSPYCIVMESPNKLAWELRQ